MTRLRLADFDAVTFDVYGTLIDWEPAIVGLLAGWAERHGLAAPPEALLGAFDAARAEIQRIRPALLYPDVLRRCFAQISERFAVPVDAETQEAFSAAPHGWPPFPDSAAGLKALQARAKIGALSNIDEASLASSSKKLDIAFDVVVTAQRVGAYKPDHAHFRTAIADLGARGIPPMRILHVGQSLRADIKPANDLGLTCVWVDRPGRSLGLSGHGAADAKPDLTVSSLEALVAALA